MNWRCALCACFAALQLHSLLTHINTNHSADQDFFSVCGIDGCQRTFKKANSLVRHVRDRHGQFLQSCTPEEASCEGDWCENVANNCSPSSPPESVQSDEIIPSSCEECECQDIETHTSTDNNSDDTSEHMELEPGCVGHRFQDKAANFLMRIKEKNRLSQRTVHNIAFATSQLFKGALNTLKRSLTESLETANVVLEDIPGGTNCFDELTHCFDGLQTGWLQAHANLPYVEPSEIVLGKKRVFAKRHNKRRIVELNEVFYYISILKTLQMQLSGSKEILEMVIGSSQSEKEAEHGQHVMEDITDGTFVHKHPLFSIDDRSLKILLYYDDVNVVNPLTNKVHKIGFFYYQLANIHYKYRSKLKSIHLFATCKVGYIKKYGIDEILKPLVEELQVLSSDPGYPFVICGGPVYLHGSVVAVIADTPASHALGGYKEGVGGARRKCRHCLTDWESMQEFFTEESFILRDYDLHEQQLANIESAGSKFLRKYFSKQYGINRRTRLCAIPDFDVTKQLPQDIMHIFLEGILDYEIKFLLQYYFDDRTITLDTLNRRIQDFPYGYSDVKNKPAPIKQKDIDFKASNNLGQSAAQMWELSRILPFVLEDITDDNNPQWRCFMLLLEIMGFCFAQKISCNAVLNLKRLITEHLILFKETYGARIRPKQHYLVHLPTQIMMFGPLIRVWCMRFEAKHAYFKDIARRLKNFKNLPLSLAKCHQRMECADMIPLDDDDEDDVFKDDFQLGKAKPLHGNNEISAKSLIRRFYESNLEGVYIFESKSAMVYGTKYACGNNNYLLLGLNDQGFPEFAKILKIWYAQQMPNPFFVTKVMECQSYCDRLGAFQICDPLMAQGNQVVQHSDLYRHQVFHGYNVNDSFYIAMKENLLAAE